VQNFDRVTVEDGDDGAGETKERSQWVEQEEKQADQVSHLSPPASLLLRHHLILDLVIDTRWDILLCARC